MKVELKNLTKEFPGRGKKRGTIVTAVNNFSFTVPDGKLVALLGPSGCGKSTMLYLISGLQTPTSGNILFGENDVTQLAPENRGVGLVFQNYALYPHLNVIKNISFPLQNLKGKDKLSKNEIKEKAIKAAKLVEIDSLLDRKPKELSGGQQQRVAIARALVKMPKILLLDEPLSNLDARLRLQTREEIRRIQKETGITTIFVTHDQDEAMSISDLIVVMKEGVLQQSGKPQEVYDNPSNLFVASFLGTPAINIFDGKIIDNTLFIGNDKIINTQNISDMEVTVGIRPEGFIPAVNGALTCKSDRIEITGRDKSVICSNDACHAHSVRAVINSDIEIACNTDTIKFNINPNKLFIFNKNTGERIYTDYINIEGEKHGN